jgi:ATP-dependent helicase/nuclease subunit A
MLPALPPSEGASAAKKYLAMRGVDAIEAKQIMDETFAILAHPELAMLFGPNSRGEVTITAELSELGEGLRVSGQIDRLAVDDDHVLIADYKTNRPPPETAEDAPRAYIAQMALYRAALQKIYPGKSVGCVLIWTHAARIMALPDSLLEREFQRLKDRQTERIDA